MNQVVRRGPIAAFFVGLWNVMNFTRRLILNFLFFGLCSCSWCCSWWPWVVEAGCNR